MDLTSDNPFWLLKNGLLANYPALEHNETCEVAVVGAGITGALIANRLVRAGVDVVVIDSRDVGQGSTSATTAPVLYEIDTHLCDLIGLVGREHAERAYLLCVEAIEKLASWISELPEACGFERKQSLYLASTERDVPRLQEECEARGKCGIRVAFLTAGQLSERFGIDADGALLSADAAQLDAFRLAHCFFKQDCQQGLRVFDRTQVTAFEQTPGGVRLLTDRGCHVSARKVIFATGYESQQYLKQRVARLKSTYALVTQPTGERAGWPAECMLWETSRPYIYVRSTEDGRILIGGEDDDFRDPARRDASIPEKTKRLLERLHGLLPNEKFEAEYAWAGTFGETHDGLAYIGASEEFPNAYFGLGFGGNGITFGVIAAEIIRDLYLGIANQDAGIFSFKR